MRVQVQQSRWRDQRPVASSPQLVERRTTALRQCAILDTAAERDFDVIAKLASEICGTPYAAISFIDEERQWFKSSVGLTVSETPLAQSFCAHTIRQTGALIVADATRDARFMDNPFVTSEPYLRFYAGVPVRAPDGTPVGALCVLDTKARPMGLSQANEQALRSLVLQVETQLHLRQIIREHDEQLVSLQSMASDLKRASEHDPLTELPNRTVFYQRLAEAIHANGPKKRPIGLVMIDVDHFKQINDSMGHDAGDALLKDFAANLQSAVRPCDTVARLGGDEFAVLLTGGEHEKSFSELATSIGERLCRPVRYRARSIDYRASIGFAQFPRDAATAEALIKCGDLALACAKLSRSCTVEFEPRLADQFESRLQAAASVTEAMNLDEIVPYYQPKVDLKSGRLVGFEALMRRVQDHSLLPLADPFDPNFVDRALTVKVGARMMSRILDDLLRWRTADLRVDQIAINSCAADFAQDDFAETLLGELSNRGLDPRLIEIEVTEGVFMGRGSAFVARALNVLSKAGVRIALDDFGTGFASLTHLKQFPVDVLKIDRSFVAGIGHNADDEAIVRAVIGLGLNLGMEIVAEGIETRDQAEFVRLHGCTVGQGFLYGAAIPAAVVQSTVLANCGDRSLGW